MNHYDTLGVSKTATQDEIKKAYRKLTKKYHPDIYQGDKAFAQTKTQELNEAYDILSDTEKRAEYDMQIAPSAPVGSYNNYSSSNSSNTSYNYTPPKYTESNDHSKYNYYREQYYKKYGRNANSGFYSKYNNYGANYNSYAEQYKKATNGTSNSNFKDQFSRNQNPIRDKVVSFKTKYILLIIFIYILFTLYTFHSFVQLLDNPKIKNSNTNYIIENRLTTKNEIDDLANKYQSSYSDYYNIEPSNSTEDSKYNSSTNSQIDINDYISDEDLMILYREYSDQFETFSSFKNKMQETLNDYLGY